MKIGTCQKCGKLVHQAPCCYHCGSSVTGTFVDYQEVHQNVQEQYRIIHDFLEEKKFDEVIRLTDILLEWMPRSAEVFWLRLLASRQCTCDGELISRGVACSADPNFINALKYAGTEEHLVYSNVQEKIDKICEELEKELKVYICERKAATQIVDLPQIIQHKMKATRERLFTLWSDLAEIERKLYALELECRLFAKEHQEVLQNACVTASSIKTAVNKSAECTERDRHRYLVRLTAAMQQSENARESLTNFKKQDSRIQKFNELVSSRDQKLFAITEELRVLKKYESELQNTITCFEKIEENQRTLLKQIQSAQFDKVRAFLGDSIFDRVLADAGIVQK